MAAADLPAHQPRAKPEGAPQVAIDAHGAGMHERVIISSDGSAARAAVGDPKARRVGWSSAWWMNRNRSARMRLGTVIGRVTLSKTVEGLRGARWLVVSPFTREHFQAGLQSPGREQGTEPGGV
jgi:microcompartment protein CcmK/EutM